MVVVECVVAIGLAIAIEIDQPHDPVAAADMDNAIDQFDPQRLIESGGDSPPDELPVGGSEPLHPPDIAIPGAEDGARAGGVSKIEPRKTQLRVPGILNWRRELIDRQRAGLAASADRPAPRSRAGDPGALPVDSDA